MKQSVIIVGAGVAGIHCALGLADRLPKRSDLKITLIDRQPYHALHSTLYHALTDQAPAKTLCLPISEILADRDVNFIEDVVTQVDPINQTLQLHQHGQLRYDYLVLALGSIPNDYGIKGLSDHASSFASFEDAIKLRREIRHLLGRPGKAQIVIGGGGIAGVELAGTLAEIAQKAQRQKKPGSLTISIIEQADQLLSGQSKMVSDGLARHLKKQGVKLNFNHGIQQVKDRVVVLDNKRTVPYDHLIWTGGVKAHPLVKASGLEVDRSGRAIVTQALRARGYSRVYVVGDNASLSIDGAKPLPQTTPHALAEGQAVARNIINQLHDKRVQPFQPRTHPLIAVLGSRTGYWSWGSISLGGRWVVWARHFVEWWYNAGLISFKTAWQREQRPRVAYRVDT